MRVFVTGATGFIGSHLTRELIANGHQVLGMTRSEEGAAALRAAGAEPHHGTIEDLASLRAGAERADGVVHLAFNHDFSRFGQSVAEDGQVIAALGEVLAGSGRPLLVTSGTAIAISEGGAPATEHGPARTPEQNPRAASEVATMAQAERGVNGSVVRLPQVHDPRRQGLITFLVQIAREKGMVAHVGEGANRWAAGAVDDVARLYRLALEKGARGATYHAVGEEGVSARAIAEAIGPRLGLPVRSITPEEAPGYFGWLGMFAALDMPASSAWTQAELGWTPTGPGLIEDLDRLEV